MSASATVSSVTAIAQPRDAFLIVRRMMVAAGFAAMLPPAEAMTAGDFANVVQAAFKKARVDLENRLGANERGLHFRVVDHTIIHMDPRSGTVEFSYSGPNKEWHTEMAGCKIRLTEGGFYAYESLWVRHHTHTQLYADKLVELFGAVADIIVDGREDTTAAATALLLFVSIYPPGLAVREALEEKLQLAGRYDREMFARATGQLVMLA